MSGDDVHRRRHELLGAFVLDHLSTEERLAVQAHLDGCAECGNEIAALQPVARALASVDVERLADRVAVPPDLGDLVVERVREEKQRRRRPSRASILLAAVAAASLIIGAGLSWLFWQATQPVVPLEQVALAQQAPGVTAEAAVVPHTWGVEIKLVGRGFAQGQAYRVTITDREGHEVEAGSFVGTGGNAMRCNLNSSVLRDDASGFTVRDATGRIALASTFG